MKYNKKILLALAIVVVIVLVILVIVTRNEAENRKEDEYTKMINNLCKVAIDLSKSNENTIVLNKEVGEYTYVQIKTLSFLTMGSENRIPLNLENPKLSTEKEPVYFPETTAVKLVVDSEKNVTCSELVDLGEGPKITLKGEKNIVLSLGEEYVEPGYTAEDKEDGDLTNKVLKSGKPNTEERGDYSIIYFLEDSMKNKTSEVRTISVK